jgi:hypothetical protein
MTSLYASFKGLNVAREKGFDDFSQMYVDLIAEDDEPIIIRDIEIETQKSLFL